MVKDDLSYELYKELEHIFTKDRVKANELYREIYGRDGSYFNIIPKVVVRPESVEEVIALIKLLPKYNEHVTFRAGGTSLSGQSVGSGIICDLKNAWKKMRVLEKGAKVWFEPGLTCAQVNKELAKYGCKMGADPASHQAAMIGGILANNSSGMEAGTKFNSYHMLSAIEFVMANGNAYNSSNPKDADRFEANERALCAGLMEIYNEIHTNTQIKNRIIEKYKIKNVTGYGMNAFVDFDNPFDIFCHLLIGSEGTLAFISSAEQNTVPLKNFYTSSLIYFNNASLAAASVPLLVETNALSMSCMLYPCS